MKNLLLALCLFPFVAHADFSLVAKNQVNAEVKALLQDVESSLPPAMKLGINKEIKINFKDLNYEGKVVWGRVLRNRLVPKSHASSIDLQRSLLTNIQTKENYVLAKKTLLHELSHIYDFQNLLVGNEKELRITNKSYTVSDSPIFLSLTGWDKKGIIRRKYVQTNTNETRRVDVYEDANPQETFAVNIESFLTDEEFQCRKPSLYSYLSKTLEISPFAGTECHTDFRLPPTMSFDGHVSNQRSIDPSRLYQVHYFFAGKGSNVMSRWGHAMLRLVMCAPSRKTVDEKCLQDRAYHLILSFRADVTNFNIDYIKGLSGKYPSKLFILPMSEVFKEYTIGELRDLYSIPLKMSEEQKQSLVSQVLEKYWDYEGKYYFVTNNCADETLNLIRNVFLNELKMVNMDVLTPLGLRNKLEKLGIADMSVFQDIEDAKKKGYFFESLGPKLQRVFADLMERQVLPRNLDTERYLNETTPADRQEAFKEITDKGIVGKFIFLEETILNRKLVALQKSIGETLNEQEQSEEGGPLLHTYQALGKLKEKQSGLDLEHGYGLPQVSDNIFKKPDFTEKDAEELKRLQKLFQAELKTSFAKEQDEIMDIMENKQLLFGQILGTH